MNTNKYFFKPKWQKRDENKLKQHFKTLKLKSQPGDTKIMRNLKIELIKHKINLLGLKKKKFTWVRETSKYIKNLKKENPKLKNLKLGSMIPSFFYNELLKVNLRVLKLKNQILKLLNVPLLDTSKINLIKESVSITYYLNSTISILGSPYLLLKNIVETTKLNSKNQSAVTPMFILGENRFYVFRNINYNIELNKFKGIFLYSKRLPYNKKHSTNLKYSQNQLTLQTEKNHCSVFKYVYEKTKTKNILISGFNLNVFELKKRYILMHILLILKAKKK